MDNAQRLTPAEVTAIADANVAMWQAELAEMRARHADYVRRGFHIEARGLAVTIGAFERMLAIAVECRMPAADAFISKEAGNE